MRRKRKRNPGILTWLLLGGGVLVASVVGVVLLEKNASAAPSSGGGGGSPSLDPAAPLPDGLMTATVTTHDPAPAGDRHAELPARHR